MTTPVRQLPDPFAASSPAPAVWLDVELPTVEENLALDEALLELAHEGLAATTCVRTWMATEPAVVLGSSCRVEVEVDLAACAADGVSVVRRPSGGGSVVLGPGCLMWSVITPYPAGTPAIEAIHTGLLTPLAAALDAALAGSPGHAGHTGRRVAHRGTSDLALVSHATEDATDLKIAGTALRVRRNGVLYHGTLLDAFNLGLVSRVLRHPPREPGYRSQRTHGAFLANLGLGRATLERIIRLAFNATSQISDWPRDRVARLVRDRYAVSDWTARL